MKILAAILIIILTYFILSFATIFKNGVSITDDPGILSRLKTFLSTHKAETADQALFKELKTPIYETSIIDAAEVIKKIAEKNAWSIEADNAASTEKHSFHYVDTTKLMRFKDDILVSLESVNSNQVLIHIASESRVGRADFGANLARVTQLIDELDKQLKRLN